LQDIPEKLREKIFEKLFSQAELAKLNPQEMRTYDESLKVYWDNYSVLQTAKHEGMELGAFQKSIQIAREMKKEGEPLEKIAKFTGLTSEEIENL
jgi:predicted transposase/invertase (TIGR01784 family)